MVAQPHFLLFCDTHHNDQQPGEARPGAAAGGRWHFVLEQLDGPDRLEAADSEFTVNRERLALLSVVRGLEALEQPSQVTLVTTSRYVSRGLRYGLNSWREADYMWERFGEQRPIRNSDLWRRVDTALAFHGVKCRLIQAGQTAVAATAGQIAGFPESQSAAVVAQAETVPVAESATVQPRGCLHALETVSSPPSGPFQGKELLSPLTATHHRPRQQASYRQPQYAVQTRFDSTAYWWSLAAAWIRWWRGRLQAKPGVYAT